MKSKNFASICTGTSNAFRRRAGTRSVGTPQVAMCVRPRTRRPFANAYGLIGPQAGQTINNNRVALSTTYTRAGVNRTVGAIDLEANGFFSEIPPEVVDEAGNPVTITETAADERLSLGASQFSTSLFVTPMYLPPIENPKQTAVDPTFRAVRPWWVVLIGAGILYLLPERFQAEWPALEAIIDWLASLVPSIARWEELSPWPGNTKLFAVFVWMMIPVQSYWLISSKTLAKHMHTEKKEGMPRYPAWKRLVVLTLFLLLVFLFFFLPFNFAIVDTAPCRVCVNTDRLAQLVVGSVFSITVSGLAAYLFALLKLFVKSINKGGNENV